MTNEQLEAIDILAIKLKNENTILRFGNLNDVDKIVLDFNKKNWWNPSGNKQKIIDNNDSILLSIENLKKKNPQLKLNF